MFVICSGFTWCIVLIWSLLVSNLLPLLGFWNLLMIACFSKLALIQVHLRTMLLSSTCILKTLVCLGENERHTCATTGPLCEHHLSYALADASRWSCLPLFLWKIQMRIRTHFQDGKVFPLECWIAITIHLFNCSGNTYWVHFRP